MTDSETLQPTIIVIFGITGDLAQRYLLPALYHLIKDGSLPAETEIVGISRQDVTTDQLLDKVELCVNEIDQVCDPVALRTMHDHTRMFQMDPTDRDGYERLLAVLNDIEERAGQCMNRLYYLSIPPQLYNPVITLMGETGLNGSCQHNTAQTRLLVEKPFGFDETSAEELIAETAEVFHEDQLFRIDHYLAKETVQNILTFRQQQPELEALWNAEHIAQIEISASEQIDISGREQFYEPVGALRDFIQSHLLQILGIVTMDLPDELSSDQIHQAKQRLLEQVQAIPADQVEQQTLRAQYDGYRQQVGNPDSTTETFAAIRLTIDNPRWQSVPIVIWTGKALAEKRTQICVTFRGSEQPNRLHFNLQPNTGIELELTSPGAELDEAAQSRVQQFSAEHTTSYEHPTAYERVLVDAVRGDRTLFATSQEVLSAWRIVQPVLEQWGKSTTDLGHYQPGVAGSELAEPLLT